MLGGLVLVAGWCSLGGSAAAESYPPALGCAVAGLASAGSGLLQVHGTGFGAGAPVLVGVDGRRTGSIRADATGSFQASWPIGALPAGATVTATDAGCSATGAVAIENPPRSAGNCGSSPGTYGPGPVARRPDPARRGKASATPSATCPKPAPPARRPDPPADALLSVPVTGLHPQLFLGLAGAVLLAGAALTGLTGRLGYRCERPAHPAASVTGTLPTAQDTL